MQMLPSVYFLVLIMILIRGLRQVTEIANLENLSQDFYMKLETLNHLS